MFATKTEPVGAAEVKAALTDLKTMSRQIETQFREAATITLNARKLDQDILGAARELAAASPTQAADRGKKLLALCENRAAIDAKLEMLPSDGELLGRKLAFEVDKTLAELSEALKLVSAMKTVRSA